MYAYVHVCIDTKGRNSDTVQNEDHAQCILICPSSTYDSQQSSEIKIPDDRPFAAKSPRQRSIGGGLSAITLSLSLPRGRCRPAAAAAAAATTTLRRSTLLPSNVLVRPSPMHYPDP